MMFLKSHKLHYKTKFQGMPISIENDKGSYRSWKDDQGNEGMTFMAFPYGYINMTMGTDGDHVDVYIGPDQNSHKVFVVHQNRPDTGEFDEDKCMLGFKNAEDAKGAYLHQYDDPRFFGEMDEYHIDDFKQMLKDRKGMKIKNDNLQKSRGLPVGTVRDWKGTRYKKSENGKWKPVGREARTLNGFPRTKSGLTEAGTPYQPSQDIDELYKMVEDATPDFQEFVDLLSKAVRPEAGVKMRSKLKSRERVETKVAEDYNGDYSRILDINGGTLIFRDERGIDRLREAISKLRPPVVRIKDRFKTPAPGGYRDYMANVTMPNGVVVEILATTEGIMKEKSEGIGHQIYEITRALPQSEAGSEISEVANALIGLSERSYGAAAANASARSLDIGIEFSNILPSLAESIGSLLPDDVKRKNWYPDLTTGISSQSKNVSLFDIASSINSIGVGDGLSKSIILKSSMEVMDMSTGKRAPLYKVKVHTAGEIMEKAKNAAIGTQATHGGKKVVKTADGWKPVKSQKHGQSSAETKKKFEKPDTSDPRYDKGAPKGSPQEAAAKKRADTSDPRYDRGAPKGSPQEAAAKKRSSKIDRTTQHIKNFDADWQVTTRMDMQGEADLANEKLDKEIVRLEGEIDKFPDNPANGQLKEKIKQLTIQATDNNKKANAKIQNPSEFMTDSQLTHFMKNWKSPALRAAAANVGSRIITEKIDNMSDSELRLYAGPEASIPKDQKAYARALEAERAGGAPRPMSKSRKLVFFPESLEKGKTSPVGTRAVHGGKKVVKTAQGWKPVGEDGKQKKSTGAPKIDEKRQAAEQKEAQDKKDARKKELAEKKRPISDKINEKFPKSRVGSERDFNGRKYKKVQGGYGKDDKYWKDIGSATSGNVSDIIDGKVRARVGAERIYNGRVYKKVQGGYGKDDKYWKDVRPATEKDRTKIQRVEK